MGVKNPEPRVPVPDLTIDVGVCGAVEAPLLPGEGSAIKSTVLVLT